MPKLIIFGAICVIAKSFLIFSQSRNNHFRVQSHVPYGNNSFESHPSNILIRKILKFLSKLSNRYNKRLLKVL